MEEENATVFRNFFFFRGILKEYVCVFGKGEGKYLGSFDYIYICLLRRRIARNVRLIVSSAQNL